MILFASRAGRVAGLLALLLTLLVGAPALAQSGKPHLLIEVTGGTIDIELLPELAPAHVERIVTLAERGFYDGVPFHRVIPGFMAQTGDPTGTGMSGSDLPDVKAEFSATPFVVGTVGAARTNDPDSFNSQFFIVNGPDAMGLTGDYTVFGRVVSGMELVQAIKPGSGRMGLVQNPDKMLSAKIAYRN